MDILMDELVKNFAIEFKDNLDEATIVAHELLSEEIVRDPIFLRLQFKLKMEEMHQNAEQEMLVNRLDNLIYIHTKTTNYQFIEIQPEDVICQRIKFEGLVLLEDYKNVKDWQKIRTKWINFCSRIYLL